MNLAEYSVFVASTSRPKTNDLKYIYPCLGLSGEMGEVIEYIKKYARGDYELTSERITDLKYEMGDVLWYFTRLANDLGLSLQDILDSNVSKLEDRRKNGKRVVG